MRLLAYALVLLTASLASAAETTHILREGETLEALARYFYGASWKSIYIVGRAGLSASTDAKVGQAYIIPASWTYKVRGGDSLPVIAKKRLGDTDRYRAVMTANAITDARAIAPGQELLMPFELKHTVGANESLNSIAQLYYHNTKQAKLIQEYNELPTQQVGVGAKLLIPIFDKDTLEVKQRVPMPRTLPDAGANDAPEPRPRANGSIDIPLAAVPGDDPKDSSPSARVRRSVKQYRAGEFDEACRDLERLLGEPRLSKEERTRVIEYCGYCAVAYNDPGAARDFFRKWLELRPDIQLDPINTSPKIRESVEEARRDIQRAAAAAAAAAANTQQDREPD